MTGRAALTCVVAAMVVLVALVVAGYAQAGLAASSGLALGSINGVLAGRAFGAGVSPRLSGLIRLAVLSAAAIAVGLLIGLDYVWLVILGVGAAQMILVGFAARSLLRR